MTSRNPLSGDLVCPALAVAISVGMAALTSGAASFPLQVGTAIQLARESGSGASSQPLLSADGSRLVFVSAAVDLVTNRMHKPFLNVFVYDMATAQTRLVSRNHNGVDSGQGDSAFLSLSADGLKASFASKADDLVPMDDNGAQDVFVCDLVTGQCERVSQPWTGEATEPPSVPAGASGNPLLSGNGQRVVFESVATNLVALDTNGIGDVFLRTLSEDATVLLSPGFAPAGKTVSSHSPTLSANGARIAFVSNAQGLALGTFPDRPEVYVATVGGSLICASCDALALVPTIGAAFHPVLSADGQWLAFQATSLSSPEITLVLLEIDTGQFALISSDTGWQSAPVLSQDGRYVAYEAGGQIWVYDGQTMANELVSASREGGGPANGRSHTPVITPDGSKVAFLSRATDLCTNATHGAFQVYLRDRLAGETRVVSVNADGQGGNQSSEATQPSLSQDGRWVAFDSTSDNLVPNDRNQVSDVFVRDMQTGQLILVSRRLETLPDQTAVAMTALQPDALSSDGRYLVFTSTDNSLVPGDTNGMRDVFVRDLWDGQVRGVSQPAAEDSSAGILSDEPRISRNGRYVLYVRRPYHFNYNAPTKPYQIMRYDTVSGESLEVAMVSPQDFNESVPGYFRYDSADISADGSKVCFTQLVNGNTLLYLKNMNNGLVQMIGIDEAYNTLCCVSAKPRFSPDGQFVLFLNKGYWHEQDIYCYARDLKNERTYLVSLTQTPGLQSSLAEGFEISADSRWVIQTGRYISDSSRYINVLYRFDLLNRTNAFLCTNCLNPYLSGDGQKIVYERLYGVLNSTSNAVILADANLETTQTLAPLPYERYALSTSDSFDVPILTVDGRYAVFSSKVNDLVENDRNGVSDIFIYDTVLQTRLLASTDLQGTGSANGPSSHPVLGADGRTVLFQSFADDLVPGDYNDHRDIFILRLGSEDGDSDGLDDSWELAYFGTLERDGAGDMDGDGQSDGEEFKAGTQPTDGQSCLHVMRLDMVGGTGTRLLWSAVPGRTYRVSFKDGLRDPDWNPLPGDVLASSSTGTKVDAEGKSAGQRYYQVMLVD